METEADGFEPEYRGEAHPGEEAFACEEFAAEPEIDETVSATYYEEAAYRADESDSDAAEEEDFIPSDLLTDAAYFEETDAPDVAKYLGLMEDVDAEDAEEDIPLRIDWGARGSAKKSAPPQDFAEEDDVVPPRISDEDFHDIDALFDKKGRTSDDISLTDEFAIVYSSRNSERNMEEIVKQPLVAPERPTNPKKHKFI